MPLFSYTAKNVTSLQDIQMYAPLLDTLRLYAGWLLAWYGVTFLLGSYQLQKSLPFSLPFVDTLANSSLVHRLAFATFLFLLLSSLHRVMGRGVGKGLVLTMVWGVGVWWFHLNA